MNAWCVAVWSYEFTSSPAERTVCKLPLVLCRRLDGTAVVLAGRCAHRASPLSAGRVVGDDDIYGHGITTPERPREEGYLIEVLDGITPVDALRLQEIGMAHRPADEHDVLIAQDAGVTEDRRLTSRVLREDAATRETDPAAAPARRARPARERVSGGCGCSRATARRAPRPGRSRAGAPSWWRPPTAPGRRGRGRDDDGLRLAVPGRPPGAGPVTADPTAGLDAAFAAPWADLAGIGRHRTTGGYRRSAWTSADAHLREWFADQAQRRSMACERDRNGNLWAWWGRPGPGAVVTGSQLLTGALDPDRARGLRDRDGTTLAEAMAAAGADPCAVGRDEEALSRIAAVVELHVEQGRALVDAEEGSPVALATGIWPHGRWHARFEGRGDHAGATRLADRSDPMLPFATTVLAARAAAEAAGGVATVGRVEVHPNGTDAIPSAVDAWLDARVPDEAVVRAIVGPVTEAAQAACAPHGAGVLSTVAPTAMLFVRNPTGTSHSPAEHAEPADCVAGVLIEVDGDVITAVRPGAQRPAGATHLAGLTLPGLANGHSHAVRAATAGGALALRRTDVRHLGVGARGDVVVLDAPSPVHLAYRPGVPLVTHVWRGGRQVVGPGAPQRGPAPVVRASGPPGPPPPGRRPGGSSRG